MAILDPTLAYGNANTRGWFHSLDAFGGPYAWQDRQGNGLLLAQYDGAPVPADGLAFGYPGMVFSGADSLRGAAASSYMAVGAKTIYFAFQVHSISSNDGTVSFNDGFIQTASGTDGVGIWLRDTSGGVAYGGTAEISGTWTYTAAVAIALDTVLIGYLYHNGAQLQLSINDVSSPTVGVGATASLAAQLYMGRNARATPNTKFMTGDVFEVITRNVADNAATRALFLTYLKSQWSTRGDSHVIAHKEGSRRCFGVGWLPRAPQISTPNLALLDLLPGDRIAVAHPQYPHRDGAPEAGADQTSVDKRAELLLDGIELDGDSMAVQVSGIDQRLRNTCFAATFDNEGLVDAWQNGPAILMPGSAIFNPQFIHIDTLSAFRYLPRASDGLICRVYPGAGQMALDIDGLIVEPASTNLLTYYSAFQSSLTGWTASAGGGGLTPVAETTAGVFLFDGVTTKNAILTQDASPTREKSIYQVSAATAGNGTILSVDHRDDAGAVLYWRLQRASDSKYWRESDRSWQAASTDNAMPESGASTIARFESLIIGNPLPTDVTTYTVTLLQQAGGTGSRVNRISFVQLEEGYEDTHVFAATSRIVTAAASVTRGWCNYRLYGPSTAPLFNLPCETLLFCVRAKFDAADQKANLGQTAYLYGVDVTTNGFKVGYDTDGEQWVCYSNTTVIATCAQPASEVTNGSLHAVALRWSRDISREGLSAGYIALSVNGREGTAVPITGSTIVDGISAYLIMLYGWSHTAPWRLAAIRSVPRVLSLAECHAWGRRYGVTL